MIPDRLRRDALRPLWQAAHHRLSSGQPVSRIRVGPLDDAQRGALADLLGMSRYPGEHANVSLPTLDDLLLETVGTDTHGVVTELIGPVHDRAGRRAQSQEQRTRLWEWLGRHEVVTAQPALHDWVGQVRRSGLVDGSVERTRELLDSALRVLRALPADGMPLPALAESVLGDPHALDEGSRVGSLVLRALAAIHDIDTPTGSQRRRQLWERAGVADDELSTVVLAAGIRPGASGPASRVMWECAERGHAAALTLAQLRDDAGFSKPPADVWTVENPSVLAMALRRFGTACPPMVCTSGWPNSAGIRLLRALAATGSILHYHGDLDGEGIRIAAYVMDKTGAHPWRMNTSDYLGALHEQRSGPRPGRVTEAPWDATLADTIRERGVAVVEERVANSLLDELSEHHVGQRL